VSVKDMTGLRFNHLTVIERAGSNQYGDALWRCRCDCGKEVVAMGYAIRNGHTKSCGHLQREVASHLNATHRLSKTRLYKAWEGMKQRCENPNNSAYQDYGARGISVCAEWHNYEVFHAWATENGYQPGLTIERKDNSKGYCPENCCLISKADQNRNTRRTHRIACNGEFITAAEAARRVGLTRDVVAAWIRNGQASSMEDIERKAKARKEDKK